ncbi:Coenzyme F420 hydrogenase/dehydrogenase, beta subunit C-terminal domain [Rhodococcus fascians]|nr:Coenzyme F420 hydrogenase/dehydrogenase, beta subunit C-terminal domain [Rhodococcus fascians]MBY3808365.1 Coenzyme F420 hydrogenase/dehydrogenase, beta subunit C-terminal domain [Rhodococcus fascians]MBY3839809.1 Coenzyme F420 hydrogenase/dehydrogenase, beta subunit C-terminal domain [Rhodococcus fascians]MBY3846672.1 Coenzyme F420 hydrogenase/dehydrogenase, beta subunit C-terminal domain [Rhodococcus fascians]MBY3848990.1 Coenzyme F420 hydrogenase/dehydrogenase, beta subunit C-terminal dom
MTFLQAAISQVTENDNCSGCGGCALVSVRVSMGLDDDGFLRPSVSESSVSGVDDEAEALRFKQICPGVAVVKQGDDSPLRHRLFGGYVSVWQGWAVDPDVRQLGSSGGVLTALSRWLIETDRAAKVVGCQREAGVSARTVPTDASSVNEVLDMAGSRYAPVGVLPLFVKNSSQTALVGKPCEVYAARKLAELDQPSDSDSVLLSFFCAGVPSQHATDRLVQELGADPERVTKLRYRGNGWPGTFAVEDLDGNAGSVSYEKSWGAHLGKQLQWRCKLCPDGTGTFADISVGDFWVSDEKGFPIFSEGKGESVVIARTHRGHDLLMQASDDGVIALEQMSLSDVDRVQPLQVTRMRTLFGRLLGRVARGKRVPRYRGFDLTGLALSNPARSARSALGTWRRSK